MTIQTTIKQVKLALAKNRVATRGFTDEQVLTEALNHNLINESEFHAYMTELAPELAPEAPEATPERVNAPQVPLGQAEQLQALLSSMLSQPQQIDEAQVIRLIDAHALNSNDLDEVAQSITEELMPTITTMIEEKASTPTVHEFKNATTNTVKTIKDTVLHECFETVLHMVNNGLQPYLVGDTGAGKSYTAKLVAEALDIPFFEQGAMVSKFEGLGTSNATEYFPSLVYKWLESPEGGLLCIDEVDASNPLAITQLMAIYQVGGSLTFPNGETFTRTEKHKLIATGNTTGNGASARFNGRTALDDAFLARFIRTKHDYCPRLEDSLAPAPVVTYCRQYREQLRAKGLKGAIISPRTLIQINTALSADMPEGVRDNIVLNAIRQGLSDTEHEAIEKAINTTHKELL